MITAADFKKHISKTLSENMKSVGFKGSGFRYFSETNDFIFVTAIQASQWGGQCCVEFGIQPKVLEIFGGKNTDAKRIKHYECEFRTRILKKDGKQWWEYSDDEESNIETANDIFNSIRTQALPIINLFKDEADILDKVELSDLDNIFKSLPKKFAGMVLMTTDIRFAWAMTKIFEKKNLEKARQFAKYGLSKLDSSSTFMGKQDFENVLNK
jgi:hypothetical protein